MEFISDIWKELRRRRGHLYQMLVSRVNGERGYCSMVSFMSANLWSWLQNCQQIPLRILNTIQTRRQIAGTKYDYETPGSNPESPKQLQLLSLLIPPELFVTVKEVNAQQGLVQGVQNNSSAPISSPIALIEQNKSPFTFTFFLGSKSASGEDVGLLQQMRIFWDTQYFHQNSD